MNYARIVKADATPHGVILRHWIDDEEGRFICTAETEVPTQWLRLWLMDIATEEDHADQQQLAFED